MRDHLIKPSTELRLLSHGLSADIYALDNPKSPRIATDSIFVGEDTQAPDFIDKGESIDEFVGNYCEQVLSCDKDDIVWRGVHKYTFNGRTEYVLAENDCIWDATVIGFIYKTKEVVFRSFNTTHVSAVIDHEVAAQFEVELARLARFYNLEIFEAVVGGDDDNQYQVSLGIEGVGNQIDNEVNELIDSIVEITDNIAHRVQVVFEYDKNNLKDFMPHMAAIAPCFKEEFDFNPMFGNAIIDSANNTITVNIAYSSLPFSSYVIEASKNIDLAQSMRDIAKELAATGDYPEITEEMVESNVVSGKPNIINVNKPTIMDEIFVTALFSNIQAVKKVISVKSFN